MSDLKLVPTHEPTELERLLLSAASNERPSDEHKLRVREALGLAIPLAALPATATSASAKTAAGSSASAGAASSAGTVGLAKALVGGVVGASAMGAVVLALVIPSKPAPAPVPPAPVAVQATPVVKATPAAPVAAPEAAAVPVSDLPLDKEEPKVKPVQKAAPSVTSEDDLRQQIVLIEAARAHVAQQNPWPALQALDTYAAKFKGGSFDQEAAVLRIKAVEQTGDRDRASGLAKSFLEKNPTSPHVDRVRRVAEPADPR